MTPVPWYQIKPPFTRCQSSACVALVALLLADVAAALPPGVRLEPRLEGELTGYVGRDGRFVIPPRFEVATPFSEGLAAVAVNQKWGFIDLLGRFVIEPQFELAGPFSEGLAVVRVGGKFGFVDQRGALAIRPNFAWAGDFSEGLAPYRTDELYGFVDARGEPAIKPRFTRAWSFSEGLAAVQLDGKYGYVDYRGETVIDPHFKDAGPFSEGLAWVRSQANRVKCISKNGEQAFEKDFEKAFSFSNGFAAVRLNQKFGLIDHRGEFVIEPVAESVHATETGLLLASGRRIHVSQLTNTTNDGPQLFAEVYEVDWIKPVKLASTPAGARVYAVEWWRRVLADDVRDLMHGRNAVTEGDTTNIETWLDGRQRWTIIFHWQQTIREKECVPGINSEVKVTFE